MKLMCTTCNLLPASLIINCCAGLKTCILRFEIQGNNIPGSARIYSVIGLAGVYVIFYPRLQ